MFKVKIAERVYTLSAEELEKAIARNLGQRPVTILDVTKHQS